MSLLVKRPQRRGGGGGLGRSGWGMEAREEQETEDTSEERRIEEGLAVS